MTVISHWAGKAVIEVLRNDPQENPVTQVSRTPPGIITATDPQTQRWLYKIRPGRETSIVFGNVGTTEFPVMVRDRTIKAGGLTLENNTFVGMEAGLVVGANGSIQIGGRLPEAWRHVLGL